MKHFITVDIGLSSGRMIVVTCSNGKLQMHEICRFKHQFKHEDQMLYLNFEYLMKEILYGIVKAHRIYGNIESIGIDTWAVDYGYIDKKGNLLRDPVCYRSWRAYQNIDAFHEKHSKESMYLKTGIRPMPFNTIYQLLDDKERFPEIISRADKILLLPDLIANQLTGAKRLEITNLSTTGLYDPIKGDFIDEFMTMGFSKQQFGTIIQPGNFYGYLSDSVLKKHQLPPIKVIAVCSHDTASAFLSLKYIESSIFISSGTWSLLGTVLKHPILNKEAFTHQYTNEIGFDHKIRFLKNITGMWVINRIIEDFNVDHYWKDGYQRFYQLDKVMDKNLYIDLEDERFVNPSSMVCALNDYLNKKYQRHFEDIDSLIWIVFHSLCYAYKQTIESLEKITQKQFSRIYIVGGGSYNEYLNQKVADICLREVAVGMTEATVLGNTLVQLLSTQTISNIEQGYELLDHTYEMKIYYPKQLKGDLIK